MDEYIGRRKLIEEGWHLQKTVFQDGLALIQRASLLDIPVADVRPVVRGKWKVFDPDFNSYSCSVCGEPFTLNDGTPQENNMNFCPSCGADTREES